MPFAPDLTEKLARARSDLRMGLPVVIEAGGSDALLVHAAETVPPARVAGLDGLGAPSSIAITDHRARTLKAHAYDGDLARIALPTGASKEWIKGIADPADDLRMPLKGPLKSLRGGNAAPHRAALHLAKAARLLPAAILTPVHVGFARLNDLTALPLAPIIPMLAAEKHLEPVVSARVPLAASEAGRVHVFRPDDGFEEHYAIEIGRPDREKPVLARLHSACFTGDVLGSLKCDCGPQLRAALAQMAADPHGGILLYLNQEGRGIGLANKMRAYSLQDQGFDTVEANHRLGFEDDERDFRLGADLLRTMGVASVRLLTNNPAKLAMMETCGIRVTERVPLRVGETPQNAGYLATKAAKSGHLL